MGVDVWWLILLARSFRITTNRFIVFKLITSDTRYSLRRVQRASIPIMAFILRQILSALLSCRLSSFGTLKTPLGRPIGCASMRFVTDISSFYLFRS
jgi:hypothetical protein